MNGRRPFVIIGGGLCGLTAARTLRSGWQLFEAGDRPGGLVRSHRRRGHTFDQTGHWLHLSDPGIRRTVGRLLGSSLCTVERRSVIFSNGVLTRYPFQVNLHGLPPQVVYECLQGYLDRSPPVKRTRRTFERFILEHFGEGIAHHFMVPYNERLWGVHPREMTDAWCRRFVPVPRRDAVLAGAVGATTPEMGYNVRFQYPREGGIELLPRALAADLPGERLHCGAEVEEIDARGRRVRVGGEWLDYRALIATLPLPELCRRLVAPPASVERQAAKLRWTSVVYLDVALKRAPAADFHWVYVPEARYPAYRVGVYSNVSPSMAPRRGASLYVELASRHPSRVEDVIRDVLALLVACGAARSDADLKFAELRRIETAYVIFDEHYDGARRRLLRYLEGHDIYPCGRYGSWDYGSMEDSMLQGRAVANQLRKRYKKSPDERASKP